MVGVTEAEGNVEVDVELVGVGVIDGVTDALGEAEALAPGGRGTATGTPHTDTLMTKVPFGNPNAWLRA
jgi:hypothetical protein